LKNFFLKKGDFIIFIIILILLNSMVFAQKAAISADEPLAVQVGERILKKGGNAVDAAVAVGFTMAVTFPQAGNIGGGGFMIIKLKNKKPIFIDYRETAPKNFKLSAFFKEGKFIKEKSTKGYLASGVPGTVKGLYKAWKLGGTLPWKDLIEPAIKLAEDGFIIRPYLARAFKKHFKVLENFEETKRIFLNFGKSYLAGDRLIQPELARTLKLIADKGPDGFYKGETADKIEKDFKKNGGWITKEDLIEYKAIVRNPIIIDFKGYKFIMPTLPSSGGPVIAEILNILNEFNIPKNDVDYYNLLAEIFKLSFYDRAFYMGDPDFNKFSVNKFLSEDYAKLKSKLIKLGKIYEINKKEMPNPFKYEGKNTTHFSIIDKFGNTVSNTYTLNSIFGSGVIVKGTGIIMNNEIDDFGFGEKNANQFGLITSDYNLAEAGKRMLSSMSPTIVLKNGKPFIISGAAGGPKIITSTIQIILNIILRGMSLREAVQAPRIHHQCFPDILLVNKSMQETVVKKLEKLGYKIKKVKYIAVANSILICEGKIYAESDSGHFGIGIVF
jgi:gamma-glutamyltranspeptidase/glutathione hydrolase